MVSYRLVAFAGLAAALPLNINLGAYSPALVVGDGEISFGGAGTAAAAGSTTGTGTTNGAAAPAPAAPAAQAAPAPVTPSTAPTASIDPTLSQQAQQIAALQGMGKEIAPRIDATNDPILGKRDLTGFDRALKYAEAALVKGPKIQLGTGEGGSGVGVIIDNNPTAAARPGTGTTTAAATGIQAQARAKRDADETSAPRRRSRVTTMYLRRGVPASLQSSSEMDVREVDATPAQPAAVQAAAPLSKRDAIDAVNLNVDGNTGVTMTFVETVEDDATED